MKTDYINDIRIIETEITQAKDKIKELESKKDEVKMNMANELPFRIEIESVDELVNLLLKKYEEPKTYHNINYISKQGKKIPKTIKEQAVKMIQELGLTGKEVVQRLKISLPSLNSIKREYGMLRPYKKTIKQS